MILPSKSPILNYLSLSTCNLDSLSLSILPNSTNTSRLENSLEDRSSSLIVLLFVSNILNQSPCSSLLYTQD